MPCPPTNRPPRKLSPRKTKMRISTRVVAVRSLIVLVGLLAIMADPGPVLAQSSDQVRRAMHRAVRFFREQASTQGGYVYQWSADLAKREGEGKVGKTTVWIEPPGTPAVGMAFLNAYRACGDPMLLEAAKETAGALLRGQLESGGWDNLIEFDPQQRAKFAYRSDTANSDSSQAGRRNVTTFDDDQSQSAAKFLMQLDRELGFQDPAIHEAVIYALDRFVKAQYSNGAWPQRYSDFPARSEDPPKQASINSDWPRTFPSANYAGFYTLNDNTMSDMIVTMLDAWEVYGDRRYLVAAIRGGEFFLRAQLPEPQPGWAQQYDQQMHPAWARKFEPPAVSGGESQGVMNALIQIYRRTAGSDQDAARFLEPLPRALAYFRRSLLDDGRLARFYELETNRPLYLTKQYELTYSPDDMPTHYGFIVSSRLDQIDKELDKVRQLPADQLWQPKTISPTRRSDSLNQRVLAIIEGLDSRGAWVEPGRLRYHGDDDPTEQVIRSTTFIKNLDLLATWLGGD